jgi:hypothetical protein
MESLKNISADAEKMNLKQSLWKTEIASLLALLSAKIQ